MWSIGIDPGRDGAAVAIAPDGVAEVLWSWRASSAADRHLNVRMVQVVDDEVQVLNMRADGPYALGHVIAGHVAVLVGGDPWQLAHEGIWLSRVRGNSIIKLALWTGRLIGPIEHALRRPAEVYVPASWRKVVGVSNAPGRSKEDAVEVVPRDLPGLAELIEAAGRAGTHEVEAGGIALCLHKSGSTKSNASR